MGMTRLSTAMAMVLVALAWTPLGAQERAVPAVGDDTLFVRRSSDDAWVAVPLSQVYWMEVRRPRSGWQGLGRGLLHGVPIGFVGGYVLGVLSEKSYDSCGDDCGLLPAVGAAA